MGILIIDTLPLWLRFNLALSELLAAPHVFLVIHILILCLSPKQIPGGTHPVSSHVLPYFGIHYLYPASLPLITCLNSSAISIVIFLLFDFLFFYPLLPYLAFTLSGLHTPCDCQLLIKFVYMNITSSVPCRRTSETWWLHDYLNWVGYLVSILGSYSIWVIHTREWNVRSVNCLFAELKIF